MDLTTALTFLARAAEARRTANRNLREAVELLADHLHGELRTGDSVSIPDAGITVRKAKVWYPVSQWSNVDCCHMRPTDAILLEHDGGAWRLDSDDREPYFDGNNLHRPTQERYAREPGGAWDIYPAPPRIQALFARHAAAIVRLFGEELQAQADERAALADGIAELRLKR